MMAVIHGGPARSAIRASRWISAIALLLSWSARIGNSQETSTAILFDGDRVPASLVEISENWTSQWKTNAGIRRLDASQLVRWGAFRDSSQGTITALASGSVLRGVVTGLSASELTLRSDVFTDVRIERRNVRGVVWRPPANAIQRDQLVLSLFNEKRSHDTLWTTNGDELAGEVTSVNDVAQSATMTMEVAQLAVISRAGTEPLLTDIGNVVAIGLTSVAKAITTQQPFGVIGLSDGDRLWTRNISMQGDQTHLTLLDDTVLVADTATLLARVTAIQVFSSHVAYISDLSNLTHKHIPFLSTAWGYGVDRNVLGGMLRCQGNLYPKGIGMHSIARLACSLDSRYQRFEADIALDDAVGSRGSVIFRVYAERSRARDTDSSWQVIYESPVVRGGDSPLPISVDVVGAQRLALVVDLADRGDEGDHANWLNARLIR